MTEQPVVHGTVHSSDGEANAAGAEYVTDQVIQDVFGEASRAHWEWAHRMMLNGQDPLRGGDQDG